MTNVGRTVLKPSLAIAVVLSALTLSTGVLADPDKSTMGQGTLVNITTPDLLAPRQWGLHADLRVFGGDEDTTYFGLGLRYGLSNRWEVGLNGNMAQFENFAMGGEGGGTIRHGGTDIELSGKYLVTQYARYNVSGQIGVGMPNTPAQKSGHLTVGLSASQHASNNIDLYINPRINFITSNTIVGLGLGTQIKLSKEIGLIGDYTPILSGANTIDTGTGNMRSHDVYGAALRYTAPNGNMSVDFGYTNGSGNTTGFSLTPGLGSSGAFYVALNLKR